MAKINRVIDLSTLQDPDQIESVEYNPQSGGKKTLPVGPRLIPIQISGGYTTNVSASTVIPYLGACLAIYNNAGAVGSITISPATAASLAPGVCDAVGNVGVACPANSWTYLSAGNNQYVISSASTLLVYIIEDPTRLALQQANGPYAQQNVFPGAALAVNV
jgi:hypothetical protein